MPNVIGATCGMGAAITAALASARYRVYTAAMQPAPQCCARRCPTRTVCFDLCSRTEVDDALARVAPPQLDLLVNNARILRDSLVVSTPLDHRRAVIDTNFLALVDRERIGGV